MIKLKSLKKNVKQHLFNISISKNSFMIFEIKTNEIMSTPGDIKFNIIESFSKQIFNNIKYKIFENLKFPNKARSFMSLKDLNSYFLFLKDKKYSTNLFLIKIYFILLKKNLNLLINIFSTTKNLLVLNSLLFVFIKKKKLLNCVSVSSYPFIKI